MIIEVPPIFQKFALFSIHYMQAEGLGFLSMDFLLLAINIRFGTISAMFPRSDKSIEHIPRYSKAQYFAGKHQIE